MVSHKLRAISGIVVLFLIVMLLTAFAAPSSVKGEVPVFGIVVFEPPWLIIILLIVLIGVPIGLLLTGLFFLFRWAYRNPLDKKPTKSREYVTCPKCGLANWAGYSSCQKCGASLDDN